MRKKERACQIYATNVFLLFVFALKYAVSSVRRKSVFVNFVLFFALPSLSLPDVLLFSLCVYGCICMRAFVYVCMYVFVLYVRQRKEDIN